MAATIIDLIDLNPRLVEAFLKFGLPKESVGLLNGDEGAAKVAREAIAFYREIQAKGMYHGEKIFFAHSAPVIEQSSFMRNLSHAGATEKDLELLFKDDVLQIFVISVLKDYWKAKSDGRRAFSCGFRMH